MDEIVSPAVPFTMQQHASDRRAREARSVESSADPSQRLQAASAGEGEVIGRADDQYVVTTAHTRQRLGQEFERARASAWGGGVDQVQDSHWGVNLLPSSSGMCL